MARPEKGGVETIPLEPGVQNVRRGKIPLRVVVEACYCPNVADKVEDELIEGEDEDEGHPDVADEVLDVDIPEISGPGCF
jgi:hypothetical protein